MIDILYMIALGILIPFLCYIFFRIISSAIFKSFFEMQAEYKKKKDNERM